MSAGDGAQVSVFIPAIASLRSGHKSNKSGCCLQIQLRKEVFCGDFFFFLFMKYAVTAPWSGSSLMTCLTTALELFCCSDFVDTMADQDERASCRWKRSVIEQDDWAERHTQSGCSRRISDRRVGSSETEENPTLCLNVERSWSRGWLTRKQTFCFYQRCLNSLMSTEWKSLPACLAFSPLIIKIFLLLAGQHCCIEEYSHRLGNSS